MLLSVRPDVYEKIKSGLKIFEHRRNFPDEPIMAYMYVSSPVKAITGVVYLVWECVDGSVIKGEDSLQGALREVKEEVGVGNAVLSLYSILYSGNYCSNGAEIVNGS